MDYEKSRRIDVQTSANGSSKLIINDVRKNDTGNYTCWPSGGAPDTVVLHVIPGKFSIPDLV